MVEPRFQTMFQNLDVKLNRAKFEIHGVDLAIVSAIRRTIITDIPVVAFRGEDSPSLEILENNGPLHNEFMLHRFGLIPIHLSEEEVEAFEADSYEFSLNAENTQNTMLNVTTKDIQIVKNGRQLTEKEHNRIFPPNVISKDHVLITRLRKGERLKVKGHAVKDVGRSHAGFSPGFCTVSFVQDPALAARATNVLDRERAYIRNATGDPTAFHMTIETECGLSTKYLFLKALELIRTRLQRILLEIYQDSSDTVKVTPWTGAEEASGFEFEFQGEDDTIGNLIQSTMFQYYVREQKETEKGRRVKFVGYVCPHPLEHRMILRMVLAETANMSEYVEVLAEHCRRIITELQAMEGDWIRFYRE